MSIFYFIFFPLEFFNGMNTEKTKMNKREKYTNKRQIEAMVNVMKKNEDIACGFSQRAPADLKKCWEELALELNALGPPLKDAGGWRKVWTDYKSGLKKKLSRNKQLLTGTGGGPYKEVPLTDLEEEVSSILNLSTAVQGIPNVSSFGVAKSANPFPNVDAIINCSVVDSLVENDIDSQETTEPKEMNYVRPLKRKRDEKPELLKEQIKIQKDMAQNVSAALESIQTQNKENYNVFKDIKRALYSLSDEKKKQTKILEKQLEEQKRHNDEMEKLLLKKM